MAKNLHFFIRFLIWLLVLGLNNLLQASEITNPVDTCQAPPPDSFRVTVVGTNFATLAWEPAWPGALHAIELEKEAPYGGWLPVSIYTHVPGESITLNGLESGTHYRAFISTYCDSLEVSSLKDDTDLLTFVLELVLNGRNPVNPVVVDCKNIIIADHEWIGFRVRSLKGAPITNYFEVTRPGDGSPSNSIGQVKRVYYNNRIVAMNENDNWPTFTIPLRQSDNPFRMGWLQQNGILDYIIGYVTLNFSADKCNICPVLDNPEKPWRSSYKFEPVVAEAVFSNSPDEDRTANGSTKDYFIQNLFSDGLKVQLPLEDSKLRDINARLVGMDGKVHFQTKFSSEGGAFTINTESLKPQMYVLILQHDQIVFSHRVVKIK